VLGAPCLALGAPNRAIFYLHIVVGAWGATRMVPRRSFEGVLGICIGCIIAKTNILVCVVGTNVPTCV